MENSRDQSENILSVLKDTYTQINKSGYALKEIISEFKNTLNKTFIDFKQIIEYFQNMWKPMIFIIKEVIDNVPEMTKKSLIILGNHGWYISLNMPIFTPVKMTNNLLKGQKEEVDQLMCSFYEANLDEIQQYIAQLHPKRTKLLNSAFKAHKKSEYDLSIPIFLSQADGICNEMIGYQLYSKNKGIPITAKFVNQFTADSFISAILEPFRVPMPIAANKFERKCKGVVFNRHQILHGDVVDYGTKVNSYKAISLLSYVCYVLQYAKTKD